MTETPTDPIPSEALALSAFLEERVLDTTKLFASDGERKGALHGHLHKRGRDWRAPTLCSYPGCIGKSIARSHTIQRQGPLSTLAEHGHVMTPKWRPDGMTMILVGLNDASTFAGFCRTHEALFDPFEATGVIATDRDLALQAFRSLCREIARQHHDLRGLRTLRADLVGRLDREVRAEAQRLGADFKEYAFTGGSFGPLDEALADQEAALAWLEAARDDHFPAVDDSGASALVGGAAQINLALPVALSGIGSLGHGGRSHSVLVGVIPQAAGSLVYMMGRQGSEIAIADYMRNQGVDLGLIDIVEAWMVRGTDHWFLTPSVWSAIPERRRAILLGEMGAIELNLNHTPPTSIFDDMRRAALAMPVEGVLSTDHQAYVAAQRAKLMTPS